MLVVEMLMARRADPSILTGGGRTALDVASTAAVRDVLNDLLPMPVQPTLVATD